MPNSVLCISGSPSPERSRSGVLLAHVATRVVAAGGDVDRIAVTDLPAQDLIAVRRHGEAATRLRDAVERSVAIVIATPVYNASMPGGLKALLDLLPERALHDKLLLPLASGGSPGHQLAIEYGLKPVLSALGARHVLAGVFASDDDVRWTSVVDAVVSDPLRLRLDDASDFLIGLLGLDRSPPGPPPVPRVARVGGHARAAHVEHVSIQERCSA